MEKDGRIANIAMLKEATMEVENNLCLLVMNILEKVLLSLLINYIIVLVAICKTNKEKKIDYLVA